MCTTMMVLTTIAVILRQRFSNKIKPMSEGFKSGALEYDAEAQRHKKNPRSLPHIWLLSSTNVE
uniref:Uncharacterized protein n=1 Tax=Xiphophorus maculatus TaxID=8083 RepID=A0A3B5R290_XIPMA